MRLCRLLPVAAFMASTSGCSDPLDTGHEPSEGYDLLFDGEVGGQPTLFRAHRNGGTFVVESLGQPGRRAAAPPDGNRIAYQTLGTAEEPSTLMLLNGQGAAPLGAPSGIAGEVSWSRDGTRIAFLSQSADESGDIFVADASSVTLTEIRNLTPYDALGGLLQPDRTPAWSPDGEWIAFTAYREGGPAIWVMREDGSEPRAVTEVGAYADFEPSWSPDSREIAFQRADGATVRIGIVSVHGGAPRFLNWPAKAYNPAWSPDGAFIAFSSNVDGDMDVFVVTPDGAEVARVRRSGVDRNAAWALHR